MRTFEDALIAGRFRLDNAARQGAERAAARLPLALNLPLCEIPADIELLEPMLREIRPDQVRLSPHSLALLKSDVRRAVRALEGLSQLNLRTAVEIVAKRSLTLADAAAAARLTSWRASEISSAVTALRRLARKLNRPLEAIPAELAALEGEIKGLSAGDLGVGRSTVSPMRSRIRRAIRLVDPNGRRPRPNRLPPEWLEILQQIETAYPDEKWRRAEITALVYFCAAKGIPPRELHDGVIASWIAEHVEERGRSIETVKKAVRAWNSLVGSDRVRLPGVRLQLPAAPRRRNLRLEELPPSLQAQWREYAARLGASDDLGDCVVDPAEHEFGTALTGSPGLVELVPGTLGNHKAALLAAATVAVENGTPLEALGSMELLLTPKSLADVLTAIRKTQEARAGKAGRRYEPRNRFRWGVAATLKGMAVKLGLCPARRELAEALGQSATKQWQAYSAIVAKVDPATGGGRGAKMGETPLERLKQFDDDAKILAWYDLPAQLIERAEALRQRGRITPESIVDVEIALVARLLRCMPVRRENIAELTIYGEQPHLRLPLRKGDSAWMYHSAGEVKNRVELQAEIDPQTVELIELWLTHYRPALIRSVGADPNTPFLLPGHTGHVNANKLNAHFRQRFEKYAGLKVNIHLNRHIVGKIMLDQDPGLLEVVSLLLGHRRVETTRSFYVRANMVAAQRRWVQILDERECAIRSQGPRIVHVQRSA